MLPLLWLLGLLGFLPRKPVIAGFNTDIEHNGTVYHVQTEDKGAPARMIMSLVYDGGTILASKRVNYEDLAAKNFDEKEVADRVSRQHKLICAAVKSGRIQELKDMSGVERAYGAKKPAPSPAPVNRQPTPNSLPVSAPPVHPSTAVSGTLTEPPMPKPSVKFEFIDPPPAPPPIAQPEFFNSFSDGPVIEGAEIIEEIELLPDDAVSVVSELSGKERTVNEKLTLELMGDVSFRGGDRKSMTIMVCRGTARKVVADAQILVKVLGSSFRPVIFHAKSDKNGLANIHLQIPHFKAGRAAVLVRAMADGDQVEFRRIVRPG